MVEKLRDELREMHSAGLIRGLRWEYGDGFCYFPVRGQEKAWSDAVALFHLRVSQALAWCESDMGYESRCRPV